MDEKMKAFLSVVAEKNGIALSPKDPIMVVFTALEYLLDKQCSEQEKIVSLFNSQMEEVTINWKQSIHQQSEELITQHFNATQQEAKFFAKALLQETDRLLDERISDTVKEFESKLHGINDTTFNLLDTRIKETRNIAMLNLVSSLIVIIAVAILVFKFTF